VGDAKAPSGIQQGDGERRRREDRGAADDMIRGIGGGVRLTRWQVELMGFEIARDLVKAGTVAADVEKLSESMRLLVTDDLSVEDKLEDEAREILKGHADLMRQQGIDYSTMFEKVKKQLIRERKLVL
jgi:hypothetical protein